MHPLIARDEHLCVKVATLYYLKSMNQEDIAARLGLSRQSVGRYLKLAREQGLVEFTIRSPLSRSSELELRLESLFGLREAVVVSTAVDAEDIVKNEIGKAAAAFLERRVQAGDVLGVSWSSTVHACALNLRRRLDRGIQVVALNGSMDKAAYSTRADHIIEMLCAAFSGTPVTLAAPLLVDSSRIRNSLLADSRIRRTYELAGAANVAMFGIGPISTESSLYKAGYMDAELLRRLQTRKAAGDICGHFFDEAGEVCDRALDERLLAVSRENLMAKPLSVGVAGGTGKVGAIRAALRGRWCNVLVTDEKTASAIAHREGRDGR
jgi:deoxyribonucleoside regulator